MVEIAAGLDEKQVCAAYDLHSEWAREDGYELDPVAWEERMRALVTSGRYNLWVAWDGNKPVAVAECHLFYDCRSHRWVGQGERTYVLPEYRRAEVFKAMFESGRDAFRWLGVKVHRAAIEINGMSANFQRFYESQGMKPVEIVMQVEDESCPG